MNQTIDLQREAEHHKEAGSEAGSKSGSLDSFQVYSPVDASPKDFVALHMDIQIYTMEQGVFLVDFKCSGYETQDGYLLEEKEVTSPFPFLDRAAQLIMQLADAD